MLVSQLSQALPASRTHDDPHARRLLQSAQGAFQKWPEGFGGFSAAIRCREGRDQIAGHVRVFTGGRVDLCLAHGPLAAWASGALSAMSLARTPRFFKDGDGRFAITFERGEEDPRERGVQVDLGNHCRRTYRIDAKGRIWYQETVEPTRRATETYDDFVRTCPGRVIPARTQIFQWDVMSQTVIETADIQDVYERRDHVWLPVCRRMARAQAATRREVVLELSEHALL
jgi:hypothetical protein